MILKKKNAFHYSNVSRASWTGDLSVCVSTYKENMKEKKKKYIKYDDIISKA